MSAGVRGSQQHPAHPPGWLPQASSGDVWPTGPARKRQQMDGQWRGVGSPPGARSREREVPGSGESRSRKATLPDQGQDGEYWSCLGHRSHTVALSVGKCRSWGLLDPLGISSGLSFLICKVAMRHPLGGGGKDKLRDCTPSTTPDAGVLPPQPCEAWCGATEGLSLQPCLLLAVSAHLAPPHLPSPGLREHHSQRWTGPCQISSVTSLPFFGREH